MMILKVAPLPEDILTLGIDGVNQIWWDAKMRAVGKARAKTLMEAAEHSVGSKKGAVSARMEIRMLLEDYESRNVRLQEVMALIKELVKTDSDGRKAVGDQGCRNQDSVRISGESGRYQPLQ